MFLGEILPVPPVRRVPIVPVMPFHPFLNGGAQRLLLFRGQAVIECGDRCDHPRGLCLDCITPLVHQRQRLLLIQCGLVQQRQQFRFHIRTLFAHLLACGHQRFFDVVEFSDLLLVQIQFLADPVHDPLGEHFWVGAVVALVAGCQGADQGKSADGKQGPLDYDVHYKILSMVFDLDVAAGPEIQGKVRNDRTDYGIHAIENRVKQEGKPFSGVTECFGL